MEPYVRERIASLICGKWNVDRDEANGIANLVEYELRASQSEAEGEALGELGERLLDWRKRALDAERDAERYRWLRVNSTQPAEGWSTHSNPESLDATVDEAMASQSRSEEKGDG